MKRLDIEPSNHAIRESIRADKAGRNRDIIDFIKLLAETKGPFSYMIDAPWGDGKTFFIMSVKHVIETANPYINPDKEEPTSDLDPILSELENSDTLFLPFYFNAWENDFADNPITALFANMAIEFERKDLLKKREIIHCITAILDAGLKLKQIPLGTSAIANNFRGKDLIQSYREQFEMRQRINRLAEGSFLEVANKIIIFIDELDRCRPDFAVKLLEQTKSLFTSENIILVFSTDSIQLSKAIGGAYGPEFDSLRFLERFYDAKVSMPPIDAYGFVNKPSSAFEFNALDDLTKELLKSRTLSIRDIQRINYKLNSLQKLMLIDMTSEWQNRFAQCALLPVLIFIEREDAGLFRDITRGTNPEALYNYGKRYLAFEKRIRDAVSYHRAYPQEGEREEPTSEECRRFVRDFCIILYGKKNTPEYEESKRRLDFPSFTSTERKIYNQLDFSARLRELESRFS